VNQSLVAAAALNTEALPLLLLLSVLLLLLLVMMFRAVGMLTARTTVDGIFSDLGLTAESLDQLKVCMGEFVEVGW